MEAMMEMLRTNAPVAAMFLLAVLYLSNENQEIRAEIADLSERTSRDIAALSQRTSEDTANLSERTSADMANLSEHISGEMADLSERMFEDMADLSERMFEEIAKLSERLARVETRVESNEQRLIRIEQILDGLRRFDVPETESPN